MKQKNQNLPSVLGIILLFCVTVGCYEPINDCLNPLAANFSLTADSACDDCCTFPSVDLRFFPLWDTLAINTSQLYSNAASDSFSIKGAQFFVSNMYLSNSLGSVLSSQDSVVLACDPSVTQYNTMKNVSLESQTAEIPSIVLEQGFNVINIDLGISSCLSSIDTSMIGGLSSSSELFNNEIDVASYLSHQFDIDWQDSTYDDLSVQFVNGEGLINLVFESEFEISRGSNLCIDIDVDYHVMLQNIQFDDTEETLKRKIIENSSQSFSLRE